MKRKFNRKAAPISVSQMDGHAVHVVEAGNPRSLALLSRAYKDVYLPAFPIPEERESQEAFLQALNGAHPNISIVIALIGDDMDTDKPSIKGMVVGYYYAKQDVGLLAYTATSPQYRNNHLGRMQVKLIGQALLDKAESAGGALRGFFLECNDPAKVKPEEDSINPTLRLKIFEKWGAKIIPIDYVQPPLEKGAEACRTLRLLAYPHPKTGQYPAADAVRGFIDALYLPPAPHASPAPEKNPDYARMVTQIESLREKAHGKKRLRFNCS